MKMNDFYMGAIAASFASLVVFLLYRFIGWKMIPEFYFLGYIILLFILNWLEECGK